MDSQSRCWLVVASVAPLAAAFSIWTLATFHAYRRQWRTVDVLFVAAVSQELVHSLFLIGHSVLNITQPNIISVCSLFIWATVSIRTFQVATLTTLILDRTFTLLWPYRYRLTVRRHQVRYHLVAMTIVSSLVGVASIFAQNPPPTPPTSYTCYLLPFDTDPEFAIFIITLHGVLSLVTFGGIIYVQIKQCLVPKTVLYSSPSSTMTTTSTACVDRIRMPLKPYLIMDNNNLNVGNINNNTLGGSSCDRGRHWMSMRREPNRIMKEFRWGAVLPIAITCHLVNIFPYLVMVGLARFTLLVPPLWLEGGSTYLALVQALLLPALLWGIDPIYKTAVAHTLVKKKQGKNDKLPEFNENGNRVGNGCQIGSHATNRSINFDTAVAYSTFVCSSDTLDKKELLLMQSNEGSRWGTATQDELSTLASFYHPKLNDPHCLNADLRRMNDHHRPLPEPVYCDPAEMIPQGSGGSGGGEQMKDSLSVEDHIYATVSDRYDKSTLSVKADPRRLTEEDNFDVDDDDLDEEDNDDVSSVTTSASDDFEFHLTRPRLIPHNMAVATLDELPNRLRCSVMNHNHLFKNSRKDIPAGNTPSRTSTLSIRSDKMDDDDKMIAGSHSSRILDDNEFDYTKKRDSLSAKQKSASLSMNDLDLLSVKTEESTEELVYVLTGKSESNLSLYRITSGEDSETLDRPLFRYAKRLASKSKPELSHQNSSRYSTWSLQEPEMEWDVSTQHSAATEPAITKHSPPTRTLDPLVSANTHNTNRKSNNKSDGSLHKHYSSRNPFLVRNRIRSNSRSKVKVPAVVGSLAGLYSSTNWKYRANNSVNLNVQRQDFPWKNMPGQNGTNMLFPGSLALPYQFQAVTTRHSSLNKMNKRSNLTSSSTNNSGNSRIIQVGVADDGLAFQRKFVSDFL